MTDFNAALQMTTPRTHTGGKRLADVMTRIHRETSKPLTADAAKGFPYIECTDVKFERVALPANVDRLNNAFTVLAIITESGFSEWIGVDLGDDPELVQAINDLCGGGFLRMTKTVYHPTNDVQYWVHLSPAMKAALLPASPAKLPPDANEG